MIGFLKTWLMVIAVLVAVAVAVALVVGVPIFLLASQLWWYAGGYIFLEVTLIIALISWAPED